MESETVARSILLMQTVTVKWMTSDKAVLSLCISALKVDLALSQ